MVYLNCKPCMQPSDDKIKIIAWPNWFKRLCMTEFFYILIPYNVNKIHTHKYITTSGNKWPSSFAFPFVCHFIIFFLAGKIYNLHKGRVGDQETMSAMPNSKSASLPFVSNVATTFFRGLVFQNLFFIL